MSKKINRWTRVVAAALVAIGATSAYATCRPDNIQHCTPQELAQLRQQAQEQVAAARSELAAALTNLNQVTANPTSTAESQAAAQARVDNANRNLATAQGGMATLNGTVQGTNTLNAGPVAASANGAAGNQTTTTIDGATYSVGFPVPGAFVGLQKTDIVAAKMDRYVTACGPDFKVTKEEDVLATTSEWAGLSSGTRPNGAVYRIDAIPGAKLTIGKWVRTYDDGNTIIEEQEYEGFQAVVTDFILGSNSQGGLNVNGEKLTGAAASAQGVQSFGNRILRLPCSGSKIRVLKKIAPPVDVCPNIEGAQSKIPDGMVKGEDGLCVVPPPKSAPAPAAAPDIDAPKAPAIVDFSYTPRKRNPNLSGKRWCGKVELKEDEVCDIKPVRENFVKDAKVKPAAAPAAAASTPAK